jgi:hypothetical protein
MGAVISAAGLNARQQPPSSPLRTDEAAIATSRGRPDPVTPTDSSTVVLEPLSGLLRTSSTAEHDWATTYARIMLSLPKDPW